MGRRTPHNTHPILNAFEAYQNSRPDVKLEKNILISSGISQVPVNTSLWSSYVQEAGRHDHEQLLNWNTTMDNLLVFAALFSAILTAFIIEIYKLLQPEPQDLTIVLLKSIDSSLRGNSSSQLPGFST
ncbi:hypothetical protein BDZ94DRAFT_825696, partial [Collybia nuda]